MPQKMNNISIVSIVKKEKKDVALIVINTIVFLLGTIGIRIIAGKFLDSYHEADLLYFTFIIVLMVCLILLADYLKEKKINDFSASSTTYIMEELAKCTCSREGKFDQQNQGKAITLFTADVNGINRCFLRMWKRLIPDCLTFIITFVLIAKISVFLGICVLLFSATQAIATWVINDKLKTQRNELQNSWDVANDTAGEGVHNLEAVKSYNLEEVLSVKYKDQLKPIDGIQNDISVVTSKFSAISLLYSFLTMFIITVYCGYLTAKNMLTIGSFFTMLTLIDGMISPVMCFNNSVKQIVSSKVNFDRLNLYINSHTDCTVPISEIKTNKKMGIIINNIDFSYNDETKVLEGFSARFTLGKCNYLLGGNGRGKSTIIKLLLGLLSPQKGSISINGVDSKSWSYDDYKHKVSVLSQDNLLFPKSILENLKLDYSDITREKIETICKKIDIHNEIMALPKQYDTILMENGEPLSGGQKKRLSIARTILKKSEIYIFDEPSASLDSNHILLLKRTLHELSKENIVIIITHDMELIDRNSNVIVLE